MLQRTAMRFVTALMVVLTIGPMSSAGADGWPQGPGPESNFRRRDAKAPTLWSAVRNENIRWRKTLPETGQSSVVTWVDRIFFTTMQPVTRDATLGQNIVGWCCDADTGETVWKRTVTADHPLQLSGCFSDSSSPSPVTDGSTVVFFNASGSIAAFDFDGNPIWQRFVMPVGRTQPTIVDGTVLFIRQTYLPDDHGHFTHDHADAPVDQWTQVQAIDLQTGADAWKSSCGANMGCVPLLLDRSDGRRVLVVGRGGGHSPPEKPEGVSMIDATDGKTLWTLELPGFMSTMTYSQFGDDVLVFHADKHLWVDAVTGKVKREVSIMENVPVRAHVDGQWVDRRESLDTESVSRAIIQQSNLLVGKYHYFRSYTQPWIGRVNCASGDVEYLQLPVQSMPGVDRARDTWLWDPSGMDPALVQQLLASGRKRNKQLPITQWAFAPNDMLNSQGFRVAGDNRSEGNGWGHHASAIPTVVGDALYVSTMAGTVYVIDWNAEALTESAIKAINDLGVPGQSWNRASITASRGRLYAHTIHEILCIDAPMKTISPHP
ncbi:outer membrane protein assembly factor BamB family protein [Rubripirellula tenax]|nr:PQQ-binding-like beta-propeller repeat protein [Rubripirellula tenax]